MATDSSSSSSSHPPDASIDTPTPLSVSSLLTPQQLHEFHDQGFTLLTNVYSATELDDIEHGCQRVLVRVKEVLTDPQHHEFIRTTVLNSPVGTHIIVPGHDGSRFTFQTHPRFPKEKWSNETVPSLDNLSLRHVAWVGKEEPVLEQYGRHPKMIGLATAFLDYPTLQKDNHSSITMIINQAHYKEPNDGIAFPYHQDSQHRRMYAGDFIDNNGKGSYVQLILALDDTTIDSGPVSFIKYSNKLGNVSDAKGLDTSKLDLTQKVTPLLRRGDIVAFGPYTIHGSDPNTSPHYRKTFINGFAYPGAQQAKDRIHSEEISIKNYTA